MSVEAVVAALVLPPQTHISRRVPKKLLIEQGLPTAADKRQIQDGIEEIHWVAALKPTSIGVPLFRDSLREYLEIAVLTVTFRDFAKPARLHGLIHRTIPYPVFLIGGQEERVTLSLAHKRWSQSEAGKTVADDPVATSPFDPSIPTPVESQFLAELPLARRPARDLFDLYQSWIDLVEALAAARIMGRFTLAGTPQAAAARRTALADHARLEREIAALRSQATRERQINRRVELNLEIRRKEAAISQLRGEL